ncbi:hypothetical protein FACS189487_02470 [Campylobacterota bacterium]|nr:hypothetical protein FACS189487_02470 [Campylobacterota bacterium]
MRFPVIARAVTVIAGYDPQSSAATGAGYTPYCSVSRTLSFRACEESQSSPVIACVIAVIAGYDPQSRIL